MKQKQLTFDQRMDLSEKCMACWLIFMLLGFVSGVWGGIVAAMQWSLLPLIPSAICMALVNVFFVMFIRVRYHPKKQTLQRATEEVTKK